MKHSIRRSMRIINTELDATTRYQFGLSVILHIEQTPQFAAAEVVAIFSSLNDEITTNEALKRWGNTKKIALPRVEGAIMQFYEYDPEQKLYSGSFSILEPEPLKVIHPQEIDLMIVPGVAFTPQGDRLGRGAGYYDKYLSQPNFKGYTIGICYPHQLIENIPCEKHDIRLNQIIVAK